MANTKLRKEQVDFTGFEDFIVGLKLSWSSTSVIIVSKGGAYFPSVSKVRVIDSDLIGTGSFSSNTWYYVYVYLSGSTWTVDMSTTAPVLYHGTGKYKNGDNARRFVGVARTDGSGNIFNFQHHVESNMIFYQQQQDASPFRVLSNGVATTETNVSLAAVVPALSRFAKIKITNTSGSQIAYLGNSIDSNTLSSGQAILAVGTSGTVITDYPLDSSQQLSYMYPSNPTNGLYVDVLGYYYER